MRRLVRPALIGIASLLACGDDAGGSSGSSGGTTLEDGGVVPTSTCKSEGGSAPVAAPKHVRNIKTGETGWFAAPAVADLDGDGKMEIIAALYSTFVFSADGTPRGAKATA